MSRGRRRRLGPARPADAVRPPRVRCRVRGPGRRHPRWPRAPSARTSPPSSRYQPVEVEPARIDALADRLRAAGHGPALTRGSATDDGPRRPGHRASSWPTRCSTRCRAPRDRPRGRPARGPGRFGGRGLRRRGGRPVDARPARPVSTPRASPWPTASAPRSASPSMPGSPSVAAGLERGLAPAHRLRLPGVGALRPGPPPRRHAARVSPPPGPRRPVRRRRPPGPDRPRRPDRRRARRCRPPGWTTWDDDPGRVPGRAGDRKLLLQAIQADPATTIEDYLGRPLGAHATPRPERDGPLPGHGVRPRLARRTAHRRASTTACAAVPASAAG